MESKKTNKADLTGKSALFFGTGLIIALVLIITSFEWKDSGGTKIDLRHGFQAIDQPIDIPVTIVTPPEPPKADIPKVRLVSEEEVPNDLPNIDIDLDPQNAVFPLPAVPVPEQDEPEDEPYLVVEVSASPKGRV